MFIVAKSTTEKKNVGTCSYYQISAKDKCRGKWRPFFYYIYFRIDGRAKSLVNRKFFVIGLLAEELEKEKLSS